MTRSTTVATHPDPATRLHPILLASASGLLVTGVVMLWMVWQTLRGLATLGDLALFYQTFNQGQRIARSLLENVGQIYNNMLFWGAFFEFLGLEPTVKDPATEDGPRSADRRPAPLDGVAHLTGWLYYHAVRPETAC